MRGISLVSVLLKMNLLTPSGIYQLIYAVRKYGMNIMILLSLAKRYENKVAIVSEDETITYKQLLSQTEKLAHALKSKYKLTSGDKVAFLCQNHLTLIKSIFACSFLGADIYLLNAKMNKNQLQQLVERHDFDLLIYDFEFDSHLESSIIKKVPSYHQDLPAINNFLHMRSEAFTPMKRTSASKIMLLTGGTTGIPKEVAHKPSMFTYLDPFLTILHRLHLLKYNTAYIATPIYHGYGIAILFTFLALGKKVIINKQFHGKEACRVIYEHQVEVITVVPIMIQSMLETNPNQLNSLRCIASGSAELSPRLVGDIVNKLGPIIYNLYGTSEAGLTAIATPEDLTYSARTIGKKINRIRLKVLNTRKEEVPLGQVGQFCIQRKDKWIETGDLGYKDEKGYYFLRGRIDDMIVSGGVNVYPIELEQVLITHSKISNVAVIGVSDERFGQRLKAFVQPEKNEQMSKEELIEWLYSKVATFQLPKEIEFREELPHTHLGKLDKKQLQ